jgi:hypothetical protein
MKRGMLRNRRERIVTAVNQTTPQADRPLHRVGKLGLAVRVPGRRLPKATIQQLIKH